VVASNGAVVSNPAVVALTVGAVVLRPAVVVTGCAIVVAADVALRPACRCAARMHSWRNVRWQSVRALRWRVLVGAAAVRKGMHAVEPAAQETRGVVLELPRRCGLEALNIEEHSN
jgi:hypothetical protein